jgi:hypothetical protein
MKMQPIRAFRKTMLDLFSRPEREPVSIETMIVAQERIIVIRVLNVSEDGFMAECDEVMDVGTELRLALPDHGSVLAEVRWMEGDRFGALIL